MTVTHDIPAISADRVAEIESEFRHMLPIFHIEHLHTPTPEEQAIVNQVHEVNEKLGLVPVTVLIHDGDTAAAAAASFAGSTALIISKKMTELLSPDEFKAFITHEFDHGTKASNIEKLNAAIEKLANHPSADKSQVMSNAMSRFNDYLEFAADSRAAKAYGAANMASALQKILIAGAQENDYLKILLFSDPDSDHREEISNEDIVKRVGDMANGTFQFPKENGAFQLCERFRRLNKQHAATVREA